MLSATGDISQRTSSWKQALEMRLDEKREERRAEEMAQVRSGPAINPISELLAADRSKVDVGTRLYLDAARLRAVKTELADALGSTEYTGMPQITKAAASLQREGDIADRLYAQARKKTSDEPGNRASRSSSFQHMSSASSVVSGSPDRRRNSEVVPAWAGGSWGRADRGLEGEPGSARINSTDLSSGISIKSPRSQSISGELMRGSPTSSADEGGMGAKKKSNPAMVDLMYNRAEIYRKRQEERVARAIEEAKELANPQLNRRSLQLANAISPERIEKFYRKSLGPNAMAAAIAAAQAEVAAEEAAQAAANPNPSAVSHHLRLARGSSARSLLSQGPGRGVEFSTYTIPEEKADPEATHHPKTLPMSTMLAGKRNPPGVSATSRLYADATRFRERREELTKKHDEMELRNCTFYPNQRAARSSSVEPRPRSVQAAMPTTNRSASVGRSAATPHKPNTQLAPPAVVPPRKVSPRASADMFRKQLDWKAEKDRRLEEERRRKEETTLTECTFQPLHGIDAVVAVLPKPRRSSLPGRVQDLQSSTGSSGFVIHSGIPVAVPPPPVPSFEVYKGVDDFLTRLTRGRQLAHDKANPKFADGTKWTGRTTQSKSFHFSNTNRGVEVKALRKPVTPATTPGLSYGGQSPVSEPNFNSFDDEYTPQQVPVARPKSLNVTAVAPMGEVATADDILARVRHLEGLSEGNGRLSIARKLAIAPAPTPPHPARLAQQQAQQQARELPRTMSASEAYFSGNGPLRGGVRGSGGADPLLDRIERMAAAASGITTY